MSYSSITQTIAPTLEQKQAVAQTITTIIAGCKNDQSSCQDKVNGFCEQNPSKCQT